MAYIVAIHDIRDPDGFWGIAEPSDDFPPGIRLHCTYPSADGSRAVCLWEGESVDRIRKLVNGIVGAYSENDFFEVDRSHIGAYGLPAAAAADA